MRAALLVQCVVSILLVLLVWDVRQRIFQFNTSPPAMISTFTLRDPALPGSDPVVTVPRLTGQEAASWISAIAMQVASMPLCTTWKTRINGMLYDAKVTTICQENESSPQCQTRHETEVKALKLIYQEEP